MNVPPFLACQLAAIVDHADNSVQNGWYGAHDIDGLHRALLETAYKVATVRATAGLNDEELYGKWDAALDRYVAQASYDVPLEEIFDPTFGGAA